jgi:hypothetical protein
MLVPKDAQNQEFERLVFESQIAYPVSSGSLIECPYHILDRYCDLGACILQCLPSLAAIFNAHAIEHVDGGWLINCNFSDCLGSGSHSETPWMSHWHSSRPFAGTLVTQRREVQPFLDSNTT